MPDSSGAARLPNAAQVAPVPALPHVAVIMSVHETVPLEFVRQALESVLQQTYRNVHPFVLCDGPVRPEVTEYLKSFPPQALRLLGFDENRGLPVALNEMLDVVTEAGRYEFVARMDADDVSEPRRIEQQVDFMLRNPDIGLLGSWCTETDEAGRPLLVKKLPTEHEQMIGFMASRNALVHSSVMARTSIFARGIRYDPALRQNQDYELWSRLAFLGVRMANIPEPLIRFRVDHQFYGRRGGWRRALREVGLKYRHLARFHLRSPGNVLMLGALLLLRTAPTWAKRLAYRRLR